MGLTFQTYETRGDARVATFILDGRHEALDADEYDSLREQNPVDADLERALHAALDRNPDLPARSEEIGDSHPPSGTGPDA